MTKSEIVGSHRRKGHSMITTRRDLLEQTGMALVAGSAAHVLVGSVASAAPLKRSTARPTLVIVYLRGGADALNIVAPYRDKDYLRYRPSLALAQPGSSAGAVLQLDDQFGFNPNLKELHELYEQGICAPIVAVGSPHGTRSHFDAQDFMERGAPGLKNVSTGWLNRYLQDTKTSKDANLRAVSLQPLLPRSLRGAYPVLARPEQKADQAMALYSQLYMEQPARMGSSKGGQQGTKMAVQEFGARTIEQLYELNGVLDQSDSSGVKYPETGFGRQMRDIAKLIKAQHGLEVTALDYGGWDHHIDEGPVTGQLGKKLADVSGSLGAFAKDLGSEQLKNTLVLVMSEFGRTAKENDNQGTDHGHGGFMLAIGGKLHGKKVYGKWTGLDESQLYEGRDLPVNTDFRIVFAEALHGLFGFDLVKSKLFPDFDVQANALHLLQGV
jgi:uncharacterized protein (DUF1501 family)